MCSAKSNVTNYARKHSLLGTGILYLSIVEDDWTDESPSTTGHLTAVYQILQLVDLHCTLKTKGKQNHLVTADTENPEDKE